MAGYATIKNVNLARCSIRWDVRSSLCSNLTVLPRDAKLPNTDLRCEDKCVVVGDEFRLRWPVPGARWADVVSDVMFVDNFCCYLHTFPQHRTHPVTKRHLFFSWRDVRSGRNDFPWKHTQAFACWLGPYYATKICGSWHNSAKHLQMCAKLNAFKCNQVDCKFCLRVVLFLKLFSSENVCN